MLMVGVVTQSGAISPAPTSSAPTLTVISSKADFAPSSAVNRRMYRPTCVNVAVVLAEAAFANVTVPGPLTFVQRTLNGPSSVAAPLNVATPESEIRRSAPAVTIGVWFSDASGVAVASFDAPDALPNASTAVTT